MHTLVSNFIPHKIIASGLCYHGMAPAVSYLREKVFNEPVGVEQNECFHTGLLFAKTEGIILAFESAHSVNVLKCKERKEGKVIAFNLSEHGNFNLQAYKNYLSNKLNNPKFDSNLIEKSLKKFLLKNLTICKKLHILVCRILHIQKYGKDIRNI